MMDPFELRKHADYQQFGFNGDGTIKWVGDRLATKLRAFDGKLPSFEGKAVLDVGTDFGFWAFLASEQGARRVLGIDRNRAVRGIGHADLVALNRATAQAFPKHAQCEFRRMELGQQYYMLGLFEIVLCLSMYHHAYAQCESHEALWFWLWRHCVETLVWEGPVDASDAVVRANVPERLHESYTEDSIREAASRYFRITESYPAEHEATRVVWHCEPKRIFPWHYHGKLVSGAGGATPAFEHAEQRRAREMEHILGYRPFPGSLNVALDPRLAFRWDDGYIRAQVLDVLERGRGLDVPWGHRWARFYPVSLDGYAGHVFRFEGESYPETFIEVISDRRLRDVLPHERVEVTQ